MNIFIKLRLLEFEVGHEFRLFEEAILKVSSSTSRTNVDEDL